MQVFSGFDGPFNFVAGVYTYENHTGWQDRQRNWARPTLYMNAEEAVRYIDWDLDGAADWSSCDDFYSNFVLAEDDEETEFVEGLGEDPEEVWGCAAGSDHTWKTGGGAGSASESKAVFVSGEYRINEQWQVSGGLRWLEDEKRIVAEIGNGDHGVYGYLAELDEEYLLPGHPAPWGGVPIRAGQVVTPATYTEIPAYDRWDLRSTWEAANGAWTVTGFVQNVLDEIAVQDMGPGGDLQAWLTEHRRIGLQVRWRPEF